MMHGCAMQSLWCGCLQGSLCKHTDDGPGAHGEMETGAMQQGEAGMGSRQRQANKGMANADQEMQHKQAGM